MTKEVFEYRTFTRLKQLEYLIRTQQIDPQFFWTNEAEASERFMSKNHARKERGREWATFFWSS